MTAAAAAVSVHSGRRLQLKQGLPLANQILGWAILLVSTATASAPQRPSLADRLAGLIAVFAPIFVILSISYETLFYFAYSTTLILWLELEGRLGHREGGHSSALEFKHLRLGLFFLFFIHVGFFGTGNVASISSFYLEPVYRLVPVFNPFLMSALLIYKLMIPFLICSVVFAAVNRRLGLPPFSLFVAALTASDVLTLNFFFLVTDRGSWLEIGQSISHFSIASLLLVFMILLHGLGEWLLGREDGQVVRDIDDHAKQD